LWLSGSDATLIGNTIQGNTANKATASTGKGGGLYLSYSDATMVGNTVASNTASTAHTGFGGGLYLYKSAATLSGNIIWSNTASTVGDGQGGGLFLDGSDHATLSGDTVVSNTASAAGEGRGGGLYVRWSEPFTLTNNFLAHNHAIRDGSGLWVGGSPSTVASGHLLHTTIAGNQGSAPAVFVGEYATLAFTNTIIAGHESVGITVTAGSTVTLQATLWYDNGEDTGGTGVAITTTNVYGDPAFVDPDRGDYHIGRGSAAIDVGTDTAVFKDIDDQARPHYGGYDLGADEWWPLLAAKVATPDTAGGGEVVTYTLTLTNIGDTVMAVRLTDTLPTEVSYLGPLTYTNGSAGHETGVVTWAGTVPTATPMHLAWPVQVASGVHSATVANTAIVSDAYGVFQADPAIVLVPPYPVQLPLALRSF
jgi:uncharacterized repeat protein (TIGR01451 family)